MTREKGLLAFLSALIAIVAVYCQIPFASGLSDLVRPFVGSRPDNLPLLAVHLSPHNSTQLPLGPGYSRPQTIGDLRSDRRPDRELGRLSTAQQIPFTLLKAHLSISSRGVLGENGLYWVQLPETEAETGALAKMRAATRLLAHHRQQTQAIEGALMAWRAGWVRAHRVMRNSAPELASILARIRTHMLAPYRAETREHLCAVIGLTLAMEAVWPVVDPQHQPDKTGVRLHASPGDAVKAPMPGRIVWSSTDGSNGLCVEVRHACELRTRVCGLKTLRLTYGDQARAGDTLGSAGRQAPWFRLLHGNLDLNPAVLLPQTNGE